MENIKIFLEKNRNKRVSSVQLEIEKSFGERAESHQREVRYLNHELETKKVMIENLERDQHTLRLECASLEKRLYEISELLNRFLPAPKEATMYCSHCNNEQKFRQNNN